MRQLFKSIITLLAVTFFALTMCGVVISATNPSLTIETSAIDEVKEFDAKVIISDNPGFASFQLNVEFDPARMYPISAERGYALYDGTMTTNIDAVLNNSQSNFVTIFFVNNVNIVGNGELLTVRFRISKDAVGTGIIKLKYDDGNFINQTFEDLIIDCVDKTITFESLGNETPTEQEPESDNSVEGSTETPQTSTLQPETSSSSNSSVNNEFVVSYATNGGSVIPDTLVSNGLILSIPPAPLKESFSFAGWYLDEALTQEYDFNTIVTKSFKLYAKWQEVILSPMWINPFSDVQTSDWFYDDVEYAVTNGLFNGISDAMFEPNTAMSRAMFVTVLWRLSERTDSEGAPFTDVLSGQWYSDAVAWATENGLVSGIGNGLFAPDMEITREQMAAIFYRYEQFSGKIPPDIGKNSEFSDWNSVSEYAKNPVNVLVIQGIVNGKTNNIFDPLGTSTRAEVAAMLHRFAKNAKK